MANQISCTFYMPTIIRDLKRTKHITNPIKIESLQLNTEDVQYIYIYIQRQRQRQRETHTRAPSYGYPGNCKTEDGLFLTRVKTGKSNWGFMGSFKSHHKLHACGMHMSFAALLESNKKLLQCPSKISWNSMSVLDYT